MTVPDLSGRIALVTGASRGIGYFIAKQMAAAGAHVIAVARTVGGLEELDDEIKARMRWTGKGEATLVPLDLADMAGIDRLGGAIHERWGKLDILVANAGVLGIDLADRPCRGEGLREGDDDQRHGDLAADPLGRPAAAPVRRRPRHPDLVGARRMSARAFWAPYAASKAAVEALARSWAEETKSLPLRVNSVDPGADAHRDARAGRAGRESRNAAAPLRHRRQHPAARRSRTHR